MSLRRVLIANRGEIAVRINRAAQALGIETVQAVSAADRDSLAAELADRFVVVGPAPAKLSYLDPRLLVHAALSTDCDALHPGYGFLSERAELAQLCDENALAFVGPTADTIDALGDKLRARIIAAEAGVPLVPGSAAVASISDAQAAAEELTYPVVIKAAAGGGGRGMFIAESAEAIAQSFDTAGIAALEAFGDGTLYLERFVKNARHVEVQLVGDGLGKVLHFGERDCSIQRRYQKVVEEAPCALMPDAVRAKLYAAAVGLLSHLRYRNAGTVEFLYDVDRQEVYFIEVNTRIQVEHPVSEQVTGVDLVQLQFLVASGSGLEMTQEQISVKRHAIEVRINAEDAHRDFMPSPGRIKRWRAPRGAGIRIDSHCRDAYVVPPHYDSMIAKLIVTANERDAAVTRLIDALNAFEIDGIITNLPLLQHIAQHADFRNNAVNTRWLEQTGLAEF